MEDLAREINLRFNHLINGYNEGKRYIESDILPTITSNKILVSALTDILNEDRTLKIIKQLKKFKSIEEILEYFHKVDPISADHCRRVGEYGKAMAEHTDDLDKTAMLEGGLMHDIGKILVPKDILHCGRIDDYKSEDRLNLEIIKYGHSTLGKLLTQELGVLNKTPINHMILYHHDDIERGGYPHRFLPPNLAKEASAVKIPNEYDNHVGALKIADHVSAMERGGYQEEHPEEAINFYLIAESNKGNLNKKYVDAFLKSRGLSHKEITEIRKKW